MDAHKAMATYAFPDLPVVTMTKVMDAVSVMRCSCALHIHVPASGCERRGPARRRAAKKKVLLPTEGEAHGRPGRLAGV